MSIIRKNTTITNRRFFSQGFWEINALILGSNGAQTPWGLNNDASFAGTIISLIYPYVVISCLRTKVKYRLQSKQDSKDQESIQSSTTPVPGFHMESSKCTINITNKCQEVSPFPSGDHKAAMNRRKGMTNTRHNINDPQKKYRLGTVSKNIFLEGCKLVSLCVNLTTSSDLDQDT